MKAFSDNKQFSVWSLIPLAVLMGMVTLFSLKEYWMADSIGYQFVVGEDSLIFSLKKLEHYSDIWRSQVNHYNTINGRFYCHVIVQLFCALWGQTAFAICNGLVWVGFVLMLQRLSGVPARRLFAHPHRLWGIVLATILLFYIPDFMPPYQINYVWMGCMVVGWLLIFFHTRTRSLWKLILIFLFSFLAGEGNESYSIPLGAIIILYFFSQRFRVSAVQWVASVGFGIGGLVLCLAPGNFMRLNDVNTIDYPLHQQFEYLLISLEPLLELFIIWLLMRKGKKYADYNAPAWEWRGLSFRNLCQSVPVFITALAIASIATGFALNFSSGARVVMASRLVFLIFACNQFARRKAPVWVIVLLAAAAIFFRSLQYRSIEYDAWKYRMITERYENSKDGIVYIPNDVYSKDMRKMLFYRYFISYRQQADVEGFPSVQIFPESMRHVPRDRDVDTLIRIDDQAWIVVQSKGAPKVDYYVEKTLLPGILNIHLKPRKLLFGQKSDVYADSTEMWQAVTYVNERPYMHSDIRGYWSKTGKPKNLYDKSPRENQ